MKQDRVASYVRENLRACQLKQLDILKEIDRICRKHQLTYWLDGGTLLGAVRHGGFIPWDDDIDIAMPLEDMKRFVELAPAELSNHLVLQTAKSYPECKEPVTKVRDLNSFYVEFADDFMADYPKGLFVDIFPFIDYPTVSRRWIRKVARGICVSYSILHSRHYYSWRALVNFFYFGLKYEVLQVLWHLSKLCCKSGTYMSNILINNGYGIMHRKDAILPVSTIRFEDADFLAPANPDAYLKDLYKDYMQIPPVEKQKIHAIFIHPDLQQAGSGQTANYE